jgi:DNA polymerase I-like protein with 3'-5' exonuclease and polymerase domains/uracil-DNA glycosylase
MPYDPAACGALCAECPLQGHRVVPPETRAGAWIAAVGEAPGEQEEKLGRPFVGPSGAEFDRSINVAGLRRNDFHISNALLCRPPNNDLRRLLTKINKANREETSKARGEKRSARLTKSPIECCNPRLRQEIAPFSNFVTLGGVGTRAVTGHQGGSILALRGGMMELDRVPGDPSSGSIKVMPTIHPAFVLRQQRWAHVFRSDLAKASRWFRGVTNWKPPAITYNPGPETLRRFLSDRSKVYTFDIETDGIECLTAHIRCIAIGTPDDVMVIGFRSNDRPKDQEGLFLDFYGELEGFTIGVVLGDFFSDPHIVKASHNGGYYDTLVLRKQMGVDPKPNLDTMILHRNVESELPHSLAYVASLYTEAPAWKTDRDGNKLALGGESDEELHEYCALDVAVTARVLAPLADQVALRSQTEVWQNDQKMQSICADMHDVGMYVDQEKRLAEEKKLLRVRQDLVKDIRDRLGIKNFNPASVYQLRDVLFGNWGLESHLDATDLKEKHLMTSSGDRSTGDLILRTLLTLRTVPNDRREIIKLIRRYRKCLKVLGTYVVKLRPWDMGADLGWDDDDDWVDQETRKKYGEEKRGIVDPRTGRMHPGYNAHVAVTGRLSSSKPINAQNFPGAQRAIVVAQPGHVLVGADMDQVELRIAAALWQVQLYLRAFAEGKDPHSMTAYAVFGDEFCKASGLTPASFQQPGKLVSSCYDPTGVFLKGASQSATDMRNLSKAVQYASQYMATVETVHQLIQKTELPAVDPKTRKPLNDGTTDLPYAKMPLRRTRGMRDKWLEGAKQFEYGWQVEIDEYREQGYLIEPVGGRRRDFLDGEDPNQIVNFKIQGGAAGLMNKALIQLHEAIPPYKWGLGTGIINQCHDSIVVECPADGCRWDPNMGKKGGMAVPKGSIPWKVARLLEECMNQTHPALPGVAFSATADFGLSWKQVG